MREDYPDIWQKFEFKDCLYCAMNDGTIWKYKDGHWNFIEKVDEKPDKS